MIPLWPLGVPVFMLVMFLRNRQGIAALGDPAQVVALVKSVCSAAPAAPEHSKFHAICLLRDLFLRRHAEPAARASAISDIRAR